MAKKVIRVAAPIAGFALGGPAGAAVAGGLSGLATGGGLKGAALGALGGAAFGAAPALGASSGLGTLGTAALTKGIQGAALGGIGGGGRGALMGAGLGALGGYMGAGGLGKAAGSTLDQVSGVAGMQGPTQGSGILGKITSAIPTGGGAPMKLGSLLGDGLSYVQGGEDMDELQRMLAAQSGQAQAQLQPYAQAGQTALQNMQAPSLEALQNDPGYQFRLQQGNQAVERSLAARGLGQSGAALKAAQEYGQGLADQTYQDYFGRQQGIASQGLGAASGLGSLYTNLGNVQAAAELERINQRNKLYSSLGGLFG